MGNSEFIRSDAISSREIALFYNGCYGNSQARVGESENSNPESHAGYR